MKKIATLGLSTLVNMPWRNAVRTLCVSIDAFRCGGRRSIPIAIQTKYAAPI